MTDTAVRPTSSASAANFNMSWGWVLALGILTVVLGMWMLVSPFAGTWAVTLVAGWGLLIGGLATFIVGIVKRAEGWLWTRMIWGVLMCVAGAMLIGNPLQGTLTLTAALGFFFLIEGIVGVVLSIWQRPAMWGLWLCSACISLLLAWFVFSEWPSSAAWILGIYAGVWMLFRGFGEIAASIELKHMQQA
jgi:uncharacterized membrane protein HdeD (DUF308 family)